MLKDLHIRHYSLIESLDVEFRSGFSVITGETGAGKSIMVGALMLLLGGRADTGVISAGARKCTVEATFEIEGEEAEDFFSSHDLDFEDGQVVIRRELTDAGKSRAFINDTPVALSVVKTLSDKLIDIHSQHQNLLLNNAGFQMEVIDSIAEDEALLTDYRQRYQAWRKAEQSLETLRQETEKNRERADILRFQYDEIAALKLKDGEQEQLEEEQRILDNAENIKQAVFEADSALNNVGGKVREARRALDHIAEVFPKAAELAERLESTGIELDDIQSELQSDLTDIRFDSNRLEEVDSRLNAIYTLLKKYHKQDVGELIAMQEQLGQSLHNVDDAETLIQERKDACAKLKKAAQDIANRLTAERKAAAQKVEKEMEERLRPLGMPNIRFRADISMADGLTPSGQDEVAFLFSANKNAPLRSLSKIASGGEIARVMLSLKAMLSRRLNLPTIIFDEIDTGVSGKIADEMANVMAEISEGVSSGSPRQREALERGDSSGSPRQREALERGSRQVISITHSPQIAARGQYHYRVFKQDTDSATHTFIEKLTPEQRVTEVAKMLSGAAVTEAALANAKTLLHL